jgi:hypothetical protein
MESHESDHIRPGAYVALEWSTLHALAFIHHPSCVARLNVFEQFARLFRLIEEIGHCATEQRKERATLSSIAANASRYTSRRSAGPPASEPANRILDSMWSPKTRSDLAFSLASSHLKVNRERKTDNANYRSKLQEMQMKLLLTCDIHDPVNV